jgi:hypothetical protein
MALVMAVAAVDSYMHGVVMRRIAHVRRRVDLPRPLARLEIPFSRIADLADTYIDAQRAGRRTRPWVQVKASLQQRLLKETFQSFEQVTTALAMAGVDDAWSKIASGMGETVRNIRDRLNALVHRRNQIVHEGDMKRVSRPRKLRFNQIRHADVQDDIRWVASLIDAADNVVSNES